MEFFEITDTLGIAGVGLSLILTVWLGVVLLRTEK